MYLKEIVATGFKSFAEKIDIKLDNKTTCIVGPNGSGKSNVVDAVRWVLGEQSVKSLRGDNLMSDVIFAGSKNRKALNVASVELIFDNSDHYLNIEYTDISIKRKAYRTGENEYFLNNKKCRLKDILSLMLDSGIGKESFNIISQGEVDKILSNSSYDRRIIIEEVAGVLKYKKRKEEALKKLEKTHENMSRVQDIITELETQVVPLKEQSMKASEYLDNKKKLEDLEIALLAFDIYNDTEEAKILKKSLSEIDSKILSLSNSSTSEDSDILKIKVDKDNLERDLANYNKEMIEVLEEISKLNSEKLLLDEKQKNKSDRTQNELRIADLIEERERLTGKINIIKSDIDTTSKVLDDFLKKKSKLDSERDKLRSEKNYLMSEFSKIDQELISLSHKKSSIQGEIDSASFIPRSVSMVLSEKSLKGIYDIIGNVLSVSSQYVKALSTAINSSKNFIITEDDKASRDAIFYLKKNNCGRATFFPLSVIRPRMVDDNTLNIVKGMDGYIDVLSNLVDYDKKYSNVIKNQLGIILVCRDIDCATDIGKCINHRYKIVTLDGDVVNVGGSLSGGSSISNSKSAITLKQEMSFIDSKIDSLSIQKDSKSNDIDLINKSISKNDDLIVGINHDIISTREKLDSLNGSSSNYSSLLSNINSELSVLNTVIGNDSISKMEDVTKRYYDSISRRDILKKEISKTSLSISDLNNKLDNMNAANKIKNQELRDLEREKSDIELKINKYDINVDNMLNILSDEYTMTYERARREFHLSMDSSMARSKVKIYKSNIKRIGMVNLDSIEEYERVNNRYMFLLKQKGDLESAQTSLMEIMNEMDGVIEEEFYKTFNALNEEFSNVFKELFVGGNAYLKLTDSDNLLTTGVDIVASPPGKKLTSISLLSGGEKTLTAISLLFAILNVRTIPFCLFDEVEAALDEANVDQFGKYLDHYKDKTQFLIITHKKKTMEYANTLYGITMQESGVSKLVSVKLNEHI